MSTNLSGPQASPNRSVTVDGGPEIEQFHRDQSYVNLYNLLGHFNVALCIVGIIGNIVSTIVLRRHGLQRTSNILLWSLAVADAIFLSGEISSSGRVYLQGSYVGWSGPYAWSLTMYIIWVLHSVCYLIGHFLSMTIPVLITTERLVATLLPMHFTRIVTPKRTWTAVGGLAVLALFYAIFLQSTVATFWYGFHPEHNATYGVKNIMEFSESVAVVRHYITVAFAFLKGIIPLCYVIVGCIIIGIKIQIAMRKREELTSKAAESGRELRTTVMLVSVCVFYILSSGIHSILRFFPDGFHAKIREVFVLECTFLTINSSVNFVIYVVVNKTLRDIYKSVILCKKATN